MATATTWIEKTDSITTIQNKLNKSGNVSFRTGKYKIKKALILPEGIKINFNGSVLQRCGSIQSVFMNKFTASTTGYSGSGNITLQNGIIEGMGGYSYDNLVTFYHSHDITIKNMAFRDSLCHALELNACSKVHVSNCEFTGYNLESPDYTYREIIQIDHAGAIGFYVSGSSATAKCYDGTHCKDITIQNCLFTKSNYRDYPYACIGTHTQEYNSKRRHQNIIIENCTFLTKRGQGQYCLSIIDMNSVKVRNCKFDCEHVARIYNKTKSYGKNSTKQVTAAYGDGSCNNVSITNNDMACSKSNAVKVTTKTGSHTNITKTPNNYNWRRI